MVVPVGADQIGQHLGVAGVGLGSRGGMAVAIARRCHRVDRIYRVTGGEQRPHHQTTVDLDADNNRLVVVTMLGDEPMEVADPGRAVRNPAFGEDPPVLGHHANIVMVFGPIHSHKEHCSSSHS
jgi:hypothetical protein